MIDETRKQETNKLRTRIKGVSYVKVAKAMGCTRANAFKLWQKLSNPSEYLYLNTINRVNKALDQLNIPKQDTEFFDDVMQSLKDTKEFMQGKDNGCRVHIPKGE